MKTNTSILILLLLCCSFIWGIQLRLRDDAEAEGVLLNEDVEVNELLENVQMEDERFVQNYA
jgi:hypothetical protein